MSKNVLRILSSYRAELKKKKKNLEKSSRKTDLRRINIEAVLYT